MNGLPYYKAYPRDFIEGTIGMPFEMKCAYRVVLDLIYMQGGHLPDDARYISGLLGCSVRKWNSIRDFLLEADKIQASGDFLTNYRAEKELETLAKLQDKQRENRSRPNKNKGLTKPKPDHTEPEPEPYRDTNVSLVIPADEISEAVAAYNATAERVGWPQVQKVSPQRRKALSARLKDAGGIDGWRDALRKAEASPFLTGENERGWRADFDFICKPQKFTKIMEGAYDGQRKSKEGAADFAQRAAERYAARRMGGGSDQDTSQPLFHTGDFARIGRRGD